MAQLDADLSVVIRRDKLENLKSGKAYNTLGIQGTDERTAKRLGIDGDPADLNGNTPVKNRMAK